MKKITIPVGVYKANVYVWVSTVEEAERAYKKTAFYKLGYTTTFHKNGAKTLSSYEYDPIVWVDSNLKGNFRIAAISHEFFHVIVNMMQERNCKIDPDNDEPYAYLMEYLMKQYLFSA